MQSRRSFTKPSCRVASPRALQACSMHLQYCNVPRSLSTERVPTMTEDTLGMFVVRTRLRSL